MKVTRSEKHTIKKNHKMYKLVDDYCFKSKNLYNYANYINRQEFISNRKVIRYNDLTKRIKHDEPFKDIGSNSGQHTLRYLDRNWKSFFISIKDWSKNPGKYLGKPRIPSYLPKNGRYVLIMTNLQTQIKDGYLYFSFKPFKPFNNTIRTKINGKHMQTRFIPKGDHYVMEIVYEKIIRTSNEVESKRIIGIDLGISRFATVLSNIGKQSFAINGGDIKAINNFYNKQLAKYRGLAKSVNGADWTNRLQRLTTKRNSKLDHLLHNVSRYIISWCIEHSIDTVIVGYNEMWKQSSVLSRKINQSFVQLPFEKFVKQLEYKCQDAGINFITTEESYTSKASLIDLDEMGRGLPFNGKRIKRGLYKTKCGQLINADVNGAGNIIRKVFPNAFADGIKGVDLHPKIVNLQS